MEVFNFGFPLGHTKQFSLLTVCIDLAKCYPPQFALYDKHNGIESSSSLRLLLLVSTDISEVSRFGECSNCIQTIKAAGVPYPFLMCIVILVNPIQTASEVNTINQYTDNEVLTEYLRAVAWR